MGFAHAIAFGDMRCADFPPGVALCRPAFVRIDLHDDHMGFVALFGAPERRTQLTGIGDGFSDCTLCCGMRRKFHREGLGDGRAIGQQVVEAFVAGVVLQLVDDRKSTVVEHQDDQFFSG